MTFDNADFGALAALWNRFYPEPFAVSEEIIRLNTVDCRVFDWGASIIHDTPLGISGFAIVKKSSGPTLYKGPDPDIAHLSAIAFTEPVVGVDLFAEVKRILRNRGIARLVFGQDSRHFFPGCPLEAAPLRDFLRVEGFEETGESFDLERDLGDYELPAKCKSLPKDFSIRPLGPSDTGPLEAFLKREFPGRWWFDTLHKVEQEGRADFVIGLFQGEELTGFAMTQDSSHRLPVSGGVWQASLGDKWGALGPIGVASKLRGKGLGDLLLGHALLDLKKRGARRSLIDWTTLDRYYGGHGFEVTRRYVACSLKLDS